MDIDELVKSMSKKTHAEVVEESRSFAPRYTELPNGPCVLVTREVIDAPVVSHYSITLQIFHTDVKRLSSRGHLKPVDNDLRRPIYYASTEDPEKHISWFAKNAQLFIASNNLSFDCVNGTTIAFQQMSAVSQHHLQCFTAWLSYCMQTPKPEWCIATVHERGSDNEGRHASIHVPGLLLPEDFGAIARGEKTAAQCELVVDTQRAPASSFNGNPDELSVSERMKIVTENYNREMLEDHAGTRH